MTPKARLLIPGDLVPANLQLPSDSFYTDESGTKRVKRVVKIYSEASDDSKSSISRSDSTQWGVGSTVFGKVLRLLNSDRADLQVFAVESESESDSRSRLIMLPSGGYGHIAMLRKNDISNNSTILDDTRLDELIRVNDVVRCKVIAKTTDHTLVSTLRPTDGVVLASDRNCSSDSDSDEILVPVSHNLMMKKPKSYEEIVEVLVKLEDEIENNDSIDHDINENEGEKIDKKDKVGVLASIKMQKRKVAYIGGRSSRNHTSVIKSM